MMTPEEIQKLGDDLLKKIVRVEVKEYDKFMPEHKIEFRLMVLDQGYGFTLTPEQFSDEAVQQVWTTLISDFLADYNFGLVAKEKFQKQASR